MDLLSPRPKTRSDSVLDLVTILGENGSNRNMASDIITGWLL
jgi:hypothetical protein